MQSLALLLSRSWSGSTHLLVNTASRIGAPSQQPCSWRQHRGLRHANKDKVVNQHNL